MCVYTRATQRLHTHTTTNAHPLPRTQTCAPTHGCFNSSSALRRATGFVSRSLRTKSLAAEINTHTRWRGWRVHIKKLRQTAGAVASQTRGSCKTEAITRSNDITLSRPALDAPRRTSADYCTYKYGPYSPCSDTSSQYGLGKSNAPALICSNRAALFSSECIKKEGMVMGGIIWGQQ